MTTPASSTVDYIWYRVHQILKRMYNDMSQMTCLVVAMYKNNAQVGWFQLAAILYCDIVPLTDVIDVDGDAGISAWRVESENVERM